MEPPFIILKPTAWLEEREWEALLGAVVKNCWSPTDNCVPENPLRYNKGRSYVQKGFNDFVLNNSNSYGRGAGVHLQNLAGFVWQGELDESFNLAGKHVRYIKLRQIDRYWEDLKQDSEVRATVPQWLGSAWHSAWTNHSVCLVTGLFLCEDVEIEHSSEAAAQRQLEGDLPLGTIASAAAASQGIPLGTDIGNMAAEVSSNRRRVQYFKSSERLASIFALQLKSITARTFKRTELQLREKPPHAPLYRLMGEEEELFPPDELILEDFSYMPPTTIER